MFYYNIRLLANIHWVPIRQVGNGSVAVGEGVFLQSINDGADQALGVGKLFLVNDD